MLQRTFPWLVGGVGFGLAVSLSLWFMISLYARPFTSPNRSGVIDQAVITSILETSVSNPEVQTLIRNQVVNYLKTAEGRARMAEALKSPELAKAMSENLKSPEFQSAVVELMKTPEFRREVIEIIKDTPEMKLLTTISSAIILDDPSSPNRTHDPAGTY